jgi:hypothetical protein
MREQMEAMKKIWRKDTVVSNGEIINVPSMQTWPKPTQKLYLFDSVGWRVSISGPP